MGVWKGCNRGVCNRGNIGVLNRCSRIKRSSATIKRQMRVCRLFVFVVAVRRSGRRRNKGPDKKKFSHDKTADESAQAFLMYSETWAARLGKTSMLNDVDIAYIPVSNGVHKFVLCLNLKYPEVIVFYNSRVRNKNGSAKQVLSLFPYMRITEVVNFAAYMRAMKHVNAEAIDKAELRRPEFMWETDNRPNDCGIFAMHHMESYMGTPIIYWNCGFVVESKKQATQLGKLRRKYVSRLLLVECNSQKGRIQTELAEMQEKNVGVKTRKGPLARN
ncbi:hypothetical protein CTI12_AA082320 [Artemisia annua]|uniref:Ubiquitin-like protease family profile domain-containing protein n=1 Tax=Artemisia annua TaxID=35608 RepID=A0A2U1Q2C1_ARTAN|nr:hypothetical protein CTI12_AA082320 [Artemisia annua]